MRQLIDYPWERLTFLCAFVYLLYLIADRSLACQAKVFDKLNDDHFLAESCSQDSRFRAAYDCDAYQLRLQEDYLNESWWQCFWNSFFFSRSWIRLGTVACSAIALLKFWQWFSISPSTVDTQRVQYIEYPSHPFTLDNVPYSWRSRRSPRRLKHYSSDSD